MNPNLKEEREKVSFNIDDMCDYFYYDPIYKKEYLEVLQTFSTDEILKNNPSEFELDRTELFKVYAKKFVRIHELYDLTKLEIPYEVHLPDTTILILHFAMFIPMLQYFGTNEQQKKWLTKAFKFEIIGAYAQTELGHGSDVQSLETTATFDKQTDEFILNSPSLTSIKWWPGDLGKTANICVTFAQLIIDGKNYGVHLFIVPIKDPETMKPYPGITSGDIGPKMGHMARDNGFLKFDHYRIPRENMLMKYAAVNRNGVYSKPQNAKFTYAILMNGRIVISNLCWVHLSHSATIATRYSIVRTQFKAEKQGPETKILDYQTQMEKILPMLAAIYTYNRAGRYLYEIHKETMRRITDNNDYSLLADLHVYLSGCKAFWTAETANFMEIARLACGGHGYLLYSGLPQKYNMFVSCCTLEGENTVMALQTARFLLKNLAHMQTGKKLSETVSYLSNVENLLGGAKCKIDSLASINVKSLEEILQMNACYWIYTSSLKIQESIARGMTPKEAWDKSAGIELVESAKAHILLFSMTAFHQAIIKANPKLHIVLNRLCLLYPIHKLLQNPVGLIESGYMSGDQIKLLRMKKEELMSEIRPDAIGLVDAFKIPDNTLYSALGVYDGNVYETLWKWANEYNSWNKVDALDGYKEAVKKIREARKKYPMPAL